MAHLLGWTKSEIESFIERSFSSREIGPFENEDKSRQKQNFNSSRELCYMQHYEVGWFTTLWSRLVCIHLSWGPLYRRPNLHLRTMVTFIENCTPPALLTRSGRTIVRLALKPSTEQAMKSRIIPIFLNWCKNVLKIYLIHCELMDNLTENNPFAINETSSNFDLSTLQSGLL